ncbi:hypothetical protein BV22DRAFT_292326 [Leucogyrophana mollusca]|uniref:Uncharacterized protein n=1 Tax=Leucogyrophana mollusca TaxID=85980 RepID=A0ACB8BQ24_9AGAM|nr:hypothetical protein BV22DRAFT_292326 [Leucogyrophana mollusca]
MYLMLLINCDSIVIHFMYSQTDASGASVPLCFMLHILLIFIVCLYTHEMLHPANWPSSTQLYALDNHSPTIVSCYISEFC